MPKLPVLTEDFIKQFIRNMTERADAFGVVAIPLSAAEYVTGVRIGAVEFHAPFTGEVAVYRGYIGGKPLHVYDIGGELVRAAA